MKDEDKTKDQLITEVKQLRQHITELEKSETGNKLVEEALRKSEELLGNILDSMSDGILVLDREFHYTHWNRAM